MSPKPSHILSRIFSPTLLAIGLFVGSYSVAQDLSAEPPSMEIMPPAEWDRIDDSVSRALKWLAAQQRRDGSFSTDMRGQPGVSALCVMAFMAHGHLPGAGQYGEQLEKALNYIASCQKRNGLIAVVAPNGPTIVRSIPHDVGWRASYNHAISALALSEGFATGRGLDVDRMEKVITKGLEATLEMQAWNKRRREDQGGWRYVNQFTDGLDSDLSATGWYLMSLRSAKNAGFEVPKEPIDDAVEYISRCFNQGQGTYQLMASEDNRLTRGMAGAGILAMAHAGRHNLPEVAKSGDWLLKNGFLDYNVRITRWHDDRYHYGVFNCCQGMYQLGGRYWAEFFPPVARVLLANQRRDGSWPADSHYFDVVFGRSYTTSLVVLSLGAPNQLLPIFQR